MVYANLSPDDILLKKKLDVLAATHPNLKVVGKFNTKYCSSALSFLIKPTCALWNIQVFYTVDNPTNDWRGGIGYVSKNMIVKGLPRPGDDTLILVSFLKEVKLSVPPRPSCSISCMTYSCLVICFLLSGQGLRTD